MTNENRRQNIAIEVARGDASFESAEILLGAKKFADATSRAYYGAFHYARALLLMLGEEPVTHAGVERLIHRDLVRSGLLPPEVAREFSRLQKMRLDADYTSEFVFTSEGSTEDLSVARQFIEAARKVLREGGWT
ncbi:MAG TPA: HEPN domain-containing protein [Polyangiaceae bacterium]|nr:HEPN domain-containing protein [Polyangiaceae bacterium]